MDTDDKAEDAPEAEGEEKAAAASEPTSFQMANPSRVLPDQEKFIRFKTPATRFMPMKRQAAAGFIVLKDSQPGELAHTSTPTPPPPPPPPSLL